MNNYNLSTQITSAIADRFPEGKEINDPHVYALMQAVTEHESVKSPYEVYQALRTLSYTRYWNISDSARLSIALEAMRLLEHITQPYLAEQLSDTA